MSKQQAGMTAMDWRAAREGEALARLPRTLRPKKHKVRAKRKLPRG